MKESIKSNLFPDEYGAYYMTKASHHIFRGLEIKHAWVEPMPETPEVIYGGDYFNKKGGAVHGYTNYDADKEPMRQVFEKFLLVMEKYVPEKKVFDVGSATGYFLDIAAKRGWQTAGSEVSDFAIKEGIRRGHTVYSYKDIASVVDTYSLVTLWDVIEHVPDPRALVEQAHSLLPEKGYIAVNTPNIASFWARLMGKRWHMFVPPEHLHYFSKESLTRLLEESGFEVQKVICLPKRFTLPYIFKTLYMVHGFRVWQWCTRFFDNSFWRQFKVPLNLHDNIFVIAQKK